MQNRKGLEVERPRWLNKSSVQRAALLREEIRRKIKEGTFEYEAYFPESPHAVVAPSKSKRMEALLQRQLEAYEHQVTNGKMSPSTYRGSAKAISGARMREWHGMDVAEVTPSALRAWLAKMDCTSKAIRNTLTPLRSLFEDDLNDGLISFNPFERIALAKLIRQTAKASDYVVSPFSAAERAQLLSACRADELPLVCHWLAPRGAAGIGVGSRRLGSASGPH